ncbi:MAG TPA: hypothetical protein VGN52_17660, partial [Burkholderiales bacterium]
MNEQLFEDLLRRSESDILDFKMTGYPFDAEGRAERKKQRLSFAKDVVSMANTPREASAFLVLGVKNVGSTSTLVGLSA